jgi:hypothetical protein
LAETISRAGVVVMIETHKFEVGQKLAIRYRHLGSPSIFEVVKVTPTGRAVLDTGIQINPNLTIRGAGEYGPFSANIVTPEIESEVRRHELISRLRCVKWGLISLDRLETIASLAIPKAES